MKNFTKQNFKTNPLWIRLLIMAFMLLAGAGNVWAVDYWVVGPAVGGWDQWKKMNQESTTRYTYSVNSGEFKITKANNWDNSNRLDNIGCNDDSDTYKGNVTCNGENNHSAYVAGTLCFNPNDSYMWIESSGTPSTELTRIVAGTPASVFGTEWDLGNQENKMTKTGDGIYTIDYYTNFQSNTTIKFKVTDGSWSNAWPSDDKSHTISEGCQKTTVTYKTNGNTVDVSTVPSNHCCSAPTSVTITRSDAPSTANICQGSTIELTANVDGSGDITYSWTKVSGSNWSVSANSTKQTCTVTAGTGDAEFKVTATRCSTSKTNTITLTADAKPTLTLESNPTICQGDQITLSDYVAPSSTGTVKWYSNSGMTEEITNPSVARTPQSNPTYYYARATNGVCSAVDKKLTVTVRATPTKYTVSEGSAENKVKLSNSQSNYTYTLYNENGEKVGNSITGSTGTALEWPVSVAGTYTVKARYTGSDCAETAMNGSYTYTPCTPADVQITSDPSNICPGGSTTFTYTAAAGANITWKMESASSAFAFTDNNGTVTVRHSNPSTIVNGANKILYTVTDANDICPASDVDTEKTITLLSVPSITASTSTTQNICYGTKATLTVTSNQGTYTWVSSDGGEAIDSKTNSVTVSKAGTYTVTVQNAGGCTSNKITFTVTVKDPVAAPTLNPKSATVCGGEAFTLLNIDGVTWSLDGKPTTGSQPGIANNTDAAIIKTFQAVKEVDGCLSAPADYKVTVNPTPVITGESVAQPGKKNAITLKLQGTLEATWEISGGDIDKVQGNSILFSAETNGTYTIKATTEEGCFDTHVVNVADAFYVYMRQPKKGENAYDNFYFPTQNPTQGGDLFYKEYASIPPAEGYADYNKGGVAHDKIFTDCDGYVWYGFKASDKLIDGTNYFTVHAPNKNGYDGWFTHTDITKPGKMTGDIYYIMGTEGNGNSGWKIEEASAPYAGPKVHASGDAKFNANNFADFVSLYVTDCSGNEVTGYQWSYTAPTCTYIGKETVTMSASTSNNIRVREAGTYTCTVKYKDGNTATSPALTVSTGATNTPALEEFTSNLPIIMVNTNGVGFPDCTGLSGQTASKNASTLKEKRSVDVIIKDGNNIIYDRKARMNYRGSSSLNFVKKSYAFCPGEADCVEDKGRQDYVKTAKLNMLGLGEAYDKDWVLYAAAADPSLMRNRLVFDSYAAMTGEWGVQSRYVELIVDGVYKGVYVFMDKITMNEKRVKVDEKTGFIVKFDKTDKEDRIGGYNGVYGDEKTFATDLTGRKDISTYDTSVDQLFEIEYPEKDDYPTGWGNRTTAIKNMFNNFENALKDGDFTTVQQYIDYTSWADWFIINEYTKNVDAYRASCIFVYTGEAGAKIEARPLWDQELSFDNTATTVGKGKACNSTSGLLVEHDEVYKDGFPAPFWFTGNYSTSNGQFTKDKYKGLLDDPCFVQVVKERWETHKAGALSEATLQNRITEYYNDLADYDESTKTYAQTSAKTREEAFWTNKSRGACDCSYDTGNTTATGYSNVTMDASKGTMDTWVLDAQRRAGLSTAISGLTGTTMNIQILPFTQNITPWEAATITINKSEGYEYTLENDLEAVSGVVVQKNGQSITYRIPRPSTWGTGDGNDSRDDITYTITATLNVADGTMVCGTTTAPSSTATIILQDEKDENCPQ